MYNVSEQYKIDIQKPIRNPSQMKVTFAIIDPDAKNASTLTDTSAVPYSSSVTLENTTPVLIDYDTFEHNKCFLDYAHKLPTESYGDYQGYVSGVMSDENCSFTTAPKLIVNFSAYFKFIGLSLTFGESRNEFITQFQVDCYNDSVLVYTNIFENSSVYFSADSPMPLHNKMEITFLKTSLPYRRVRLAYVGFGLTKTFTDSTLISATHDSSTDILSTVLPKNDFSFTFLDVDNEYNPDNSSGIFEYIESLQPIKVEYGYELDNGVTEWILGTSNLTNGDIKTVSDGTINTVTINTTNSLIYLDDIYDRGVYTVGGTSLYNLAIDVLAGTDVSYVLDNSLQLITTTGYLPVDSKKNCLQLIANAGRCVLSVDRDGIVKINKPYSIDDLHDNVASILTDNISDVLTSTEGLVTNDFAFTNSNMLEKPVLNKYPKLKNLAVSYYNYKANVVAEVLSEMDIVDTVAKRYYFPYEASSGQSVVLTGTLIASEVNTYYANGCFITLTGTGKITISGNKVISSENKLSDTFGTDGLDCNISNVLITNETVATEYLEWLSSIMKLRNVYSIENRGFPELDCVDSISVDTNFTNVLPSIVTGNKIEYDGTLSGISTILGLT